MADGILDTQPPLFTSDMDEQPFSTVFSAGILQSICGLVVFFFPVACSSYVGYAGLNATSGDAEHSVKEIELLRLFATFLLADGISMIYTARCGSMCTFSYFSLTTLSPHRTFG